MTSNDPSDIIFIINTKFPFEWYVTWRISANLKFWPLLTTHWSSVVGPRDSKPSPMNSPYQFTYINCHHMAPKFIKIDFGNFDRKSKWQEKSVFPVEFWKTVFCIRFLRVWRRLMQWEHNSKKFRKLFYDPLILIRDIRQEQNSIFHLPLGY